METIKLTLAQVLELEAELNGFVNPQTGEKVLDGFLKQNISMLVRYRLGSLVERLAKEKEVIGKLHDELVVKYGEEKDGMHNVNSRLESGEINPNFLSFQREYAEILSESIELEYTPLSPKDIDQVTTTENYNLLLKIIKE